MAGLPVGEKHELGQDGEGWEAEGSAHVAGSLVLGSRAAGSAGPEP